MPRWRRAIPNFALHVFIMRDSFIAIAFREIKPYWKRIEVPRCCKVELPMVFTYHLRDLRDPKLGWWVVGIKAGRARSGAGALFTANAPVSSLHGDGDDSLWLE